MSNTLSAKEAFRRTMDDWSRLLRPGDYSAWRNAGATMRLSGVNAFVRYNLDWQLYGGATITLSPRVQSIGWQGVMSNISISWDDLGSHECVMHFDPFGPGFLHYFSCIAYSWVDPSGGISQYLVGSGADLISLGEYPTKPSTISFWWRTLQEGALPGPVTKMILPVS